MDAVPGKSLSVQEQIAEFCEMLRTFAGQLAEYCRSNPPGSREPQRVIYRRHGAGGFGLKLRTTLDTGFVDFEFRSDNRDLFQPFRHLIQDEFGGTVTASRSFRLKGQCRLLTDEELAGTGNP